MNPSANTTDTEKGKERKYGGKGILNEKKEKESKSRETENG